MNIVDEKMKALTAIVCGYYEIPVYKLFTKNRSSREFCFARQIVMYLGMKYFKLTIKDVSKYFNRTHATAIHARKAVNDQLATNKKFPLELSEIKLIINKADVYTMKSSSRMCKPAVYGIITVN